MSVLPSEVLKCPVTRLRQTDLFCLGPTITVVSTRSGRVFGGYTSESWAGVDYKAAPRSFLFLMYSSHGKYTPAVFPGA